MEDIDNGAHAVQKEEINGYVIGFAPLKFLKYIDSPDGWFSLSAEDINFILRGGAEKGKCAFFVAVPTPDEAERLEDLERKKDLVARHRKGNCGCGNGCDKTLHREFISLVPKNRVDGFIIAEKGKFEVWDKVWNSVPGGMQIVMLGSSVERSPKVRG